jgi:hypothetical protein
MIRWTYKGDRKLCKRKEGRTQRYKRDKRKEEWK